MFVRAEGVASERVSAHWRQHQLFLEGALAGRPPKLVDFGGLELPDRLSANEEIVEQHLESLSYVSSYCSTWHWFYHLVLTIPLGKVYWLLPRVARASSSSERKGRTWPVCTDGADFLAPRRILSTMSRQRCVLEAL